jgi:mannose-1-phosphate guanylyltransferase/mannose-6-phosphate isomerase
MFDMTHTLISPVILCGGSGTRLWPLSRKSYPKQFARLVGEETLFQSSAKRLSGSSGPVSFAAPTILTASDFRFIVTEQLSEIGIDPGAILIEPESRNTAPAILAAALHLSQKDPEAIMLVAPSDHVVPDAAAFHRAIEKGLSAVAQGKLVTFGIKPTHAETAYGYLELTAEPDASGAATDLKNSLKNQMRPAPLKCSLQGHSCGMQAFFSSKPKTF